MNFRQLEAFVAVATTGSFRSAATQLGLTQPAISSRIGSLETEIGEDLFIRNRHPVRLTEKGLEILPHAEQLLVISQNISPARVLTNARTERTTLRIGTNTSLISAWLPELTWHLCGEMPDVNIEYETGSSYRLRDLMMRGSLDFCLMHAPPESSGIKSVPLGRFQSIWAAQAGLFPQKKLGHRQLSKQLIVTFRRDSIIYSQIESSFRGEGFWPVRLVTTASSALIAEMILRAPSIGTVVARAVARELENGALEAIETPVALPNTEVSVCYPIRHSNDFLRHAVNTAIKWTQEHTV